MTLSEMWVEVKRFYNLNVEEYTYVGIRFEDKQRAVGEICECSKHNTERDDERDFPEFGTEDYNEMTTLDGTSAWDLGDSSIYKYSKLDANKEVTHCFIQDHCYIVAGDYITNCDDCLDDGEIVIEEAKVVAQIF